MKKIFPLWAFVAMMCTFTACLNDDNDEYFSMAMGTLLKENQQYYIDFDGNTGSYNVPDSSVIVLRKLQKPGQRVIAMYNVISSGGRESARGSIKLRDIFAVLTKPFDACPTTPEEDKKLGNDVVSVSDAWIAGGCLNVKFSVPMGYEEKNPHKLSAFDSGLVDEEGYKIIDFRHNLNGNGKVYWSAFDYVAFTLPEYDVKPKGYKLRFQYSENEKRTIKVN